MHKSYTNGTRVGSRHTDATKIRILLHALFAYAYCTAVPDSHGQFMPVEVIRVDRYVNSDTCVPCVPEGEVIYHSSIVSRFSDP